MIEIIHYDPKYHEDLLKDFFKLPNLPDRNKDKKSIHYDSLIEDGVLLLIMYKNQVRGMECCKFIKEEDIYWAKFPWRVVHYKLPYYPRYIYEKKIYEEIYKRNIKYCASFWNVSNNYHKRLNKQMKYIQKHQKSHIQKLSSASLNYLPHWKLYNKQVYESFTWSIPIYCNLENGSWFLNREEKEINEEYKLHFEPHSFY